MQCAYCIIPKVRPVLRSRPVEQVLQEVARLVDHGHREIVLTGIHLGHYGVDLAGGGQTDLSSLVERIAAMDGDFRLRLSSLEAAEVTPRLIDVLAGHPDRICPHLHLSMQSGSDAVLQRMQRRYTSRQFIGQCQRIGLALDRPALTTDVIVGFPGETEADFLATCEAVQQVGFSKIHVFRFSRREGTAAADLPDQVPGPVKRRRGAELAERGRRLRRRFFEGLLGRPMQVLVESPDAEHAGLLVGTSERYAPVELRADDASLGRLVRCRAGSVVGGRIRATGGTAG